jgi:hypothetical protein
MQLTENQMSFHSRKTAAIALAGVFTAAAVGLVYEHQAHAGQKMLLCVDNLLIPQTVEQAEYLEHHAAEAYAAYDKAHDPKNSPLLAPSIAEYEKQGKTVTVTGFDPKAGTATLPDGTKRPMGCYILSVK